MEIYVIRHTRVDVPPGTCYGQSDVDAAATFNAETEELRNRLPASFDAVYSSPLRRCIQLAREFGNEIVPDDRLKEMHFGTWEMKEWDVIPGSEIAPWYQDFVNTITPGGENFRSVYERVYAFMEHLRLNTGQQKVLIVCHAGIIRSIWCYLLQIPLQNAFKIPVGFGEVLHFQLGKCAAEDYLIQKK